MSGRDEAQAAYFALLRAREELELLTRHEEYLRAELQRLRRTAAEEAALRAAAPPDPLFQAPIFLSRTSAWR